MSESASVCFVANHFCFERSRLRDAQLFADDSKRRFCNFTDRGPVRPPPESSFVYSYALGEGGQPPSRSSEALPGVRELNRRRHARKIRGCGHNVNSIEKSMIHFNNGNLPKDYYL